jgi:hypothetical protein
MTRLRAESATASAINEITKLTTSIISSDCDTGSVSTKPLQWHHGCGFVDIELVAQSARIDARQNSA